MTITDMLGTLAPAPWRFDGHGINDNNGQRVAKVSCCEPYEYPDTGPKRNATFDGMSNLIAAAPELAQVLSEELEALEIWATAECEPDVLEGIGISVSKIRSVLTKAGIL